MCAESHGSVVAYAERTAPAKVAEGVSYAWPIRAKSTKNALLAEHARGERLVLRAGDMLFVPNGIPHRVVNLSPTVALSANYVDGSNIEDVLQHLEEASLFHPRSAELRLALQELPRTKEHLQVGGCMHLHPTRNLY